MMANFRQRSRRRRLRSRPWSQSAFTVSTSKVLSEHYFRRCFSSSLHSADRQLYRWNVPIITSILCQAIPRMSRHAAFHSKWGAPIHKVLICQIPAGRVHHLSEQLNKQNHYIKQKVYLLSHQASRQEQMAVSVPVFSPSLPSKTF
jgi:hypothetical protein